MRIAIGSIMHETNSFSPIPTPFAAFHEGLPDILDGPAVLDANRGAKTGIGGFLDVAAGEGWEVIGTVAGHATPSANVQAQAHEQFKGRLIEHLRRAGRLDGVLLYLHGAMLSENAPDAEGDICRAVREVIGPDVPVVVELDLHGNMTAAFCAVVDAVFVYDTNPHVDAYERGVEAARCLAAILTGTLPRPRVYISKPPMLPPTINMRTAEGPMTRILERAREWEAGEGIVNVAVFPGFPFADFDQAGTSILVTATDPAAGRRCADDIGRFTWSIREQFLKPIPDVPSAVARALQLASEPGEGPVVLADVADNPGGGGSGDTTALLHELVRRGVTGAVACVWDPETVQQALSAGAGAEADFRIGGKAAPGQYGAPLAVRGRVARLSDGRFTGWGPVFRGREGHAGPSACIDVNGLKLVVTTYRQAANDRGFFAMAGVYPEREPILVVKSRGHFRADYEPIARAVIEVDAPGAANPNLERFSFQHVRRPIWPLDRETEWDGHTSATH
jgi:microcystin degradation protein MlrC